MNLWQVMTEPMTLMTTYDRFYDIYDKESPKFSIWGHLSGEGGSTRKVIKHQVKLDEG